MTLELPEELTIAEVQSLCERLRTALEGGGPVVLDAGGVAEVDAAGLQVLCAARRSAAALGVRLTLRGRGRGEALAHALEIAGLLGAPDAVPAWEDRDA
jgi:anti-anti-sigma regulatory factor